ncbi:MAG: helix-turn-helix domain-containing protein [Halodesulfurarchaeum sp.]|nr:helix-turn-helix domain-containing protein [Halodesulfurarchaeum sp.]
MATHQQTSLEATEAGHLDLTPDADQLWIELEIDRMENDSCPVREFGDESVNGHVQLVGDRCHASLTVGGSQGNNRTVVSGSITDACTCPRVCKPGIIPAEILVADGSLEITAIVDSRERLYELSDRFRESGDEWQLRRLTTGIEREQGEPDRGGRLSEEISLTDKQQEVVEEAVGRGYYANPREASLADLAAELDVTRSALSQRLNAVEAKLIKTLAAEL